jgi:DNA-binding transcriptional LysR family regulator
LDVFCEVARKGGLRRAALSLGLSVSTVSVRLQELETRVGRRLFHRNTRSLALTETGADLFAAIEPALGSLDHAIEAGLSTGQRVTGRLRINVAPPAAEAVVAPLLGAFMDLYPDIDLELAVDDGLVDIVKQGFDAGVRYREALSADMIAVRLQTQQQYALVARPDLLDRIGWPIDPWDLRNAPAIRHRFPSGGLLPWEFERAGELIRIEPKNRLVSNSASLAVAAALEGVGLLMTMRDYAEREIDTGRLACILENWLPPFEGPYLYYYSRRLLTPALRAFIDYAQSHRDATKNAGDTDLSGSRLHHDGEPTFNTQVMA